MSGRGDGMSPLLRGALVAIVIVVVVVVLFTVVFPWLETQVSNPTLGG